MQRRSCAGTTPPLPRTTWIASNSSSQPSWLSMLLCLPNAPFGNARLFRTRRVGARCILEELRPRASQVGYPAQHPGSAGSHPKTHAVDIGRKRQVWPFPNRLRSEVRELGSQALPTEGFVRETRSYLPVRPLMGSRSPTRTCAVEHRQQHTIAFKLRLS